MYSWSTLKVLSSPGNSTHKGLGEATLFWQGTAVFRSFGIHSHHAKASAFPKSSMNTTKLPLHLHLLHTYHLENIPTSIYTVLHVTNMNDRQSKLILIRETAVLTVRKRETEHTVQSRLALNVFCPRWIHYVWCSSLSDLSVNAAEQLEWQRFDQNVHSIALHSTALHHLQLRHSNQKLILSLLLACFAYS